MTPDQYVAKVVSEKTPPIYGYLIDHVKPVTNIITLWAGKFLNQTKLSGSHAKGTSVVGSNDVDIFISLKHNTFTDSDKKTLGEIYDSLAKCLENKEYEVRRQNVSIGIKHDYWAIDLVPAVHYGGLVNDHWLYKRKRKTRTKTNIDIHINKVKNSGRNLEIRAMKIWKDLHNLVFPSFYLELVVLEALSGYPLYNPAGNVDRVLEYLASEFQTKVFYDPANTSNKISDDLENSEKKSIADLARKHRYNTTDWGDVIW